MPEIIYKCFLGQFGFSLGQATKTWWKQNSSILQVELEDNGHVNIRELWMEI